MTDGTRKSAIVVRICQDCAYYSAMTDVGKAEEQGYCKEQRITVEGMRLACWGLHAKPREGANGARESPQVPPV